MTVTMTITIILEWSIMQLFMMEEKTLLLLSIKPDYQPVLALQMLVQVLLLIIPLFLGMDWIGLIAAAANEALRVQRSLECEVAAAAINPIQSIPRKSGMIRSNTCTNICKARTG